MIPLGLSGAELAALHSTLADNHSIRVGVEITDLAGSSRSSVSHLVLGGQVNADIDADVSRSCTLTLLDPDRSLPFDSDSPAASALYLDRMIRVTYSVLVGTVWRDVPVFLGPVTKLARDGDTVSVEAQGKEVLALGACWKPLVLGKGVMKSTAIQRIMSWRAGETEFSIPDVPGYRLPANLSLDREAKPWLSALALAKSMNRQLFYDGSGVLRLRTFPGTPVYTWTGQTMCSPLQVGYSQEAINLVWVQGGTPRGSKTPLSRTAVAPASHPLSPQRLGRNGAPRFLLQTVVDDSIRSASEANAVAEQTLATGLLQAVDVSFTSLPIPHLEPGDMCRATTDEGASTFLLRKFSLPLKAEANATMSVGYLSRVSVTPRKGRR